MMGRTHVAGGAVAWVVSAPLLDVSWQATVIGLVVGPVASLAPDLDHKNSALSRVMPPISWAVRKVTTHRVQTHSLLSIVLVYAGLHALGYALAVAMAVHWASHILLDGITRDGVAWFWPLTREKSSLMGFLPKQFRIRTNGLSETIFSGIMCSGFVVYMVVRLVPG